MQLYLKNLPLKERKRKLSPSRSLARVGGCHDMLRAVHKGLEHSWGSRWSSSIHNKEVVGIKKTTAKRWSPITQHKPWDKTTILKQVPGCDKRQDKRSTRRLLITASISIKSFKRATSKSSIKVATNSSWPPFLQQARPVKPCSTTNSIPTNKLSRLSSLHNNKTSLTRELPPCPGSYKTRAKPDQSNSTGGKLLVVEEVTICSQTCHLQSMPMQAIGWHRTRSTKAWSWCQARLSASSKPVQILCSHQKRCKTTTSQTRVSQAKATQLRKDTTFSCVDKYTTTNNKSLLLINHQNLTSSRYTIVILSCSSLFVCHLTLRIQSTLKTQLIRLQSRRHLKTHLLKRWIIWLRLTTTFPGRAYLARPA